MNTKSIVFLLVLVIVAVTVVNGSIKYPCPQVNGFCVNFCSYGQEISTGICYGNNICCRNSSWVLRHNRIHLQMRFNISSYSVYDKHGGGSRRCLVFVLSTLNPIDRCLMMIHRVDVMVLFIFLETLTALFKTNFNIEYPFDPQELFVFALIG
ncbi:Chloride channel protein 2-like 6 [Homarus americanus]|uniref:Chloride channel protein 2-like 4 n=1 Tax=Homarus americanus TaxID=6706 RepID=A0A8J5MKU9_HOMAM|nr:Chloride channel protein 2-like 4 [Homarus americanus]KAG7173313.1 Chloride channel protein 2-like 6 [Homarus americanus]